MPSLRSFSTLWKRLSDKPYIIMGDVVIFVIGPSGAGKSTFINVAVNESIMSVADHANSLQSRTRAVHTFRCACPGDIKGPDLVFVDVPALEHSEMTRTEVCDIIKQWLKKNAAGRKCRVGILYLHRINPRMNEKFTSHFDPFVKICQDNEFYPEKALLVTTMWPPGKDEQEASRIENDLLDGFQKSQSPIACKSRTSRFTRQYDSACQSINILLKEMGLVE